MSKRFFTPYFIFCFACLFFLTGNLKAQDIHYSMFNRSPMNLSPGLVGIFAGDLRVTANYRQQWKNVPVNYKTFTTTLEYKIAPTASKNGFFTLGAYFNNDKAGDLALRTNQLGGGVSYFRRISSKHFLSGGLQLGGSFRNFDAQNIRVDVQYLGDRFDAGLPHQEGVLINQLIKDGDARFLSLAAGINYRYQNTDRKNIDDNGRRTRIDIGGAIYHFNQPRNNFNEATKGVLSRRFSLYGISSFKLLPDIDLGFLISGQFQGLFQGPYQEVVVGVNGRFYLENKQNVPLNFLLGLSYRIGDALIPNIGLDYRNFSFGFSYDFNISKFDVATNSIGGAEFSVIYTLAKVYPVEAHKICPIY